MDEFTPYAYQVRALDSLWRAYKRGQGSALLALATGLGKTFVVGMLFKRMLAEDPQKRILVLANQRPLLKQFEKAIWRHLPKEVSTHLWYGSEKPAYDEGVTIATFQTVKNTLENGSDLSSFEVVVADEAHHAPAHTYREVMEEIGPSFLLGLTATPWRADERTLHDLFGPPASECTVDAYYLLGVKKLLE